MQDKRTNIDRKFTDRAWGEMRQLLDREMPTQKRRRRAIFWWWLLPVGLVLGVAAWSFLKNQATEKPAAPTAILPTQPVAENSKMPAGRQLDTTSAGFGTLPTLGAEKSAGQNLGGNLKLPPKLDEEKNATQAFEFEANNQFVFLPLPTTLPQNSLAKLTHPAIFPSLHLPASSPKSSLKNSVEPDLTIQKTNPSKPSLSIYAGGMATAGSPANGLAAGSAVAFPLKNSKLSLEGGLGYAFVQQPLSVQVNQNVQSFNTDEVLYSIRSNFSNKSAPEAYASTNYSTGLQLHYLQAPLLAGFRLGSKFSVHGGAVAAYLINTEKGFDQQISLDAGGSDPVINAENSSVQIPLSRFDLAATGGLTWHFSPAFALDFRYQFGVADLLKSNGIGDYNRLFQLSFRYEVKNEVKSKKAKGKS